MRHSKALISGAAALVMLLALVSALAQRPASVTAAPQAIVTPVASVLYDDTFGRLTFLAGTSVTADGGGTTQNVSPFRTCDVQWDVDVTLVNTTTLTLQFSNDNTYWSNGAVVASAVTTDTGRSTTGSGNLSQFAVFGRYGRVYYDVTNSSPITPSISALCH